MRLFEQFEVPDMVITVANTAVSTASLDDPNIVSLPIKLNIENS